MHQGSPFSTTSPAHVVCWFVYDGHSDRCEVVSHCGFNLHLWWLVMLTITMSLGPLCVLLGEMSVQVLWPFLIELFVFLRWSHVSSLYILKIKPLSKVSSANTFFPFHFTGSLFILFGWFPFHFTAVFFSPIEAFYFDKILFVYSFLYVHCSRVARILARRICCCGRNRQIHTDYRFLWRKRDGAATLSKGQYPDPCPDRLLLLFWAQYIENGPHFLWIGLL